MNWLGFLTLLIFLGLGLYIPIKCLWIDKYNKPNTFGDYIGTIILTILSEISALFIFIMFTLFIGNLHYPKYTENIYGNKVPIYSIGLNSSVEGQFLLGGGSVDGKSTYRYFAKVNGGYKCFEVDADKTTIIETDNCKPYIQFITGKKCTCDGNFLMSAYFGDDEDFWRKSFRDDRKEQIIYIPKGSVIQTYEIKP